VKTLTSESRKKVAIKNSRQPKRLKDRFRLPANCGETLLRPVIFPPGRARLSIRPTSTGSPLTAMTIGIVLIGCVLRLPARARCARLALALGLVSSLLVGPASAASSDAAIVDISPVTQVSAQDIAQFDARWMGTDRLQRLADYEYWLKNRQAWIACYSIFIRRTDESRLRNVPSVCSL
jgi:hypothetical protein